MKIYLFLFFAGFMVKCDDSNNYYVIDMPETSRRDANKPFHVYWNVPTMQCKSKKIPFDKLYQNYGILQNDGDSFIGEKISILYDPGNFPAMLKDDDGEIRYRNGGVPQEGDLEDHINVLKAVIDKKIPDPEFKGVGIIDFESWRPVFRQNFGKLTAYKDVSYKIERKRHWLWPESWIKSEAKKRFENYGRKFMQTSLSIAKQMRPRALWGYYGFPYCFNMNGHKQKQCPKEVLPENDGLYWLWSESSALFPSVYSPSSLTSYQLSQLISGRVSEAARVKRWSSPILPYFSYKYYDNHNAFFSEEDLRTALSSFYNSEASGFIIWGSSNDVNTVEKCKQLHKYVEQMLGPAVAKYTKTNKMKDDENEPLFDVNDLFCDNSTEVSSSSYVTSTPIDNYSTNSTDYNENVAVITEHIDIIAVSDLDGIFDSDFNKSFEAYDLNISHEHDSIYDYISTASSLKNKEEITVTSTPSKIESRGNETKSEDMKNKTESESNDEIVPDQYMTTFSNDTVKNINDSISKNFTMTPSQTSSNITSDMSNIDANYTSNTNSYINEDENLTTPLDYNLTKHSKNEEKENNSHIEENNNTLSFNDNSQLGVEITTTSTHKLRKYHLNHIRKNKHDKKHRNKLKDNRKCYMLSSNTSTTIDIINKENNMSNYTLMLIANTLNTTIPKKLADIENLSQKNKSNSYDTATTVEIESTTQFSTTNAESTTVDSSFETTTNSVITTSTIQESAIEYATTEYLSHRNNDISTEKEDGVTSDTEFNNYNFENTTNPIGESVTEDKNNSNTDVKVDDTSINVENSQSTTDANDMSTQPNTKSLTMKSLKETEEFDEESQSNATSSSGKVVDFVF